MVTLCRTVVVLRRGNDAQEFTLSSRSLLWQEFLLFTLFSKVYSLLGKGLPFTEGFSESELSPRIYHDHDYVPLQQAFTSSARVNRQ